MKNLFVILKKGTAVLVSSTLLTSSISAMNPLNSPIRPASRGISPRPLGEISSNIPSISSFEDLLKYSIYCLYINHGPKNNHIILSDKCIPVKFLESFYNIFRGYIGFEDVSRIKRNISKDAICDLIEFIRQYEFNGGFKSICAISFLTFECITRTSGVVGDFGSIGFDITKLEKEIISFEELKEVLIARLESLLEAWGHRHSFW